MATRAQASLAADAAAYIEKSAGAVEILGGTPSEIRLQSEWLVKWANQRGVVLPNDYVVGLNKNPEKTTEHEVYFRHSDHRVVKCTFPGSFGHAYSANGKPRKATPLFYLRRLELSNQVFGDDLILEGISFGIALFDVDRVVKPYAIISQAWVDDIDDKDPLDEEIAIFMKSVGFVQIQDSCYRWFRESDGLMVSDAKPANFIKSKTGFVFPVDVIISKTTPDMI